MKDNQVLGYNLSF